MKNRERYRRERDDHRATGAALVRIVIETRVPSKWRFVDLETGDVWKWEPDPRTEGFETGAEDRGRFTRENDPRDILVVILAKVPR